MKKLFISIFLFIIFITIIYAHSTYTGYTRKNSTVGCNCHGSANPSVIVEITGPNQVQIGKTETFQVSISGGNGSEVCVDIAASVGSLQPYDSNLKLSNNELITNGKKTYGTNGKYVYTFNYTAPNTVGQATIFATGMASKNSGWNFAPDKTIQVVNSTDISKNELPNDFVLLQNYPNPFNPSTVISYQILEFTHVSLKVYDVLGREVATLVDEYQKPGTYSVLFNAYKSLKILSSGIYYYRLQSSSFSQSMKMIYLK